METTAASAIPHAETTHDFEPNENNLQDILLYSKTPLAVLPNPTPSQYNQKMRKVQRYAFTTEPSTLLLLAYSQVTYIFEITSTKLNIDLTYAVASPVQWNGLPLGLYLLLGHFLKYSIIS